jgi:hypothetical protein
MFLFPGPGGGDDFFKRGMLRFPAEDAVELVFAGDKDSRIAGTTGRHFARNFAAGDFFSYVNDFENGEAATVANVEGFAGNGFDRLEGANVRVGDVENVDVIADAGAVGRWIVRAKNFDVGDDALRGIENFGDQVSFDAMMLTAFGRGARSVEIAERGEMKAGVCAIVGKNFFEANFGFAVRIDGKFGMVLGDGDGVRFAVCGCGGRENEFVDAVANHGVEKIYAGGDIGGVKGAWLADGFRDQSFSGKMHDCVNFVLRENLLDFGADA